MEARATILNAADLERLQATVAALGERVTLATAFGPIGASERFNGVCTWSGRAWLAHTIGDEWALVDQQDVPVAQTTYRPIEPTDAALWILDAGVPVPAELLWVLRLATLPAGLAQTLEYVREQQPELLGSDKPKATTKRSKPRRTSHPKQPRKLTGRETEVLKLYGDENGNFSAVARQLGIDESTVRESYQRALKKLGKAALPKPGTRQASTDRRGQIVIADGDDRR